MPVDAGVYVSTLREGYIRRLVSHWETLFSLRGNFCFINGKLNKLCGFTSLVGLFVLFVSGAGFG